MKLRQITKTNYSYELMLNQSEIEIFKEFFKEKNKPKIASLIKRVFINYEGKLNFLTEFETNLNKLKLNDSITLDSLEMSILYDILFFDSEISKIFYRLNPINRYITMKLFGRIRNQFIEYYNKDTSTYWS